MPKQESFLSAYRRTELAVLPEIDLILFTKTKDQGIRESVEPQIKVAGISYQGIRESVEFGRVIMHFVTNICNKK